MSTKTLSREEKLNNMASFLKIMSMEERSSSVLGAVIVYIKDFDDQENRTEFGHLMNEACLNGMRVMQGGLVATLLDKAMATAAAAYSDDSVGFVTQDLYIQYLEGVPFVPELMIRTRLTRVGKRSISVSAELFSGETLCCTAMGTFGAILRKNRTLSFSVE